MGSLLGRWETQGSQVSEAKCYMEGRMADMCEWELGKHHTASLSKRFANWCVCVLVCVCMCIKLFTHIHKYTA